MPKHIIHFTDNLKFSVKISYGKDAMNKWDFSLVLKVCMEFDDVTSAGKLFHVCKLADRTGYMTYSAAEYVIYPVRSAITATAELHVHICWAG